MRESEGRDGCRFDTAPTRRQDRRGSRLAHGVILAIGVYLALAYLVLPAFWRHYEHLPPMADTPKLTRAPDGPYAAVRIALRSPLSVRFFSMKAPFSSADCEGSCLQLVEQKSGPLQQV